MNANYAWLKSKANPGNIKSAYLLGHSRGGSLAARLAQRFKNDFPGVKVILQTFDPVANMKKGELGTYPSVINNPTVNFPREPSNRGNWSWRTNFYSLFPNRYRFLADNYVVGGSMFDLALDVRSFSHETAYNETLDQGWLHQQWYPTNENAGGHMDMTDDFLAIWRALLRLSTFKNNLSPQATVTVSSTYCLGSDCYSGARINNEDLSSGLGGQHSWTNSAYESPQSQWIRLDWPTAVMADHVELISTTS